MNDGRRTLLVLAIVFVVLAVITVLRNSAVQQSINTQIAEGLPLPRVLPDVSELDIQAVRLQDPASGRELTIAREPDGTWTSPGQARAIDQEAGALIARTISLLPYHRTLEGTISTDDRVYGFTPTPTLLVQIVLTRGEAHAIAVGALAPSGDAYYAIVDEQPGLYLLEHRAVDFLRVILRDSTA